MNVSVEHITKCKALLRIALEPGELAADFAQVEHDVLKHASLPGFRPGKAPKERVLKVFESRIADEVKRKALNESYKKALEEHHLRPVTPPDIEEVEFGRDSGLRYHATVEVEDQFELPNYRGLMVSRPNRVVTEEDVNTAIDRLRDQQASFTTVNRPLQPNDFVVVNYRGTVDGKPITDLVPTARGLTEQKNFWIHAQPGNFLPGFSDQLLGAVAGDKRTVTVTFPPDFVSPQLIGRTAVYEVEVVEVKEKVLSPVDEAFAKSLGAESVEQLRAGVRRDLENELKYTLKRNVQDQLVRQLLSAVSFELPEALVQAQTRSVVYDIVRANQQRGVSKEAIDEKKDEIYSFANASAKERVKLTLILNRIAEKEGVKVTQEELSRRIVFLAAQNNLKPEKLAKQLQERGGLNELHQQILSSKVLDLIELHANVQEIPAASGQA